MIWLTWRQFRLQAWVTAAALAVIAVLLGVTGTSLARLYDTSGIATCHGGACGTLVASFLAQAQSSYGPVFYGGIGLLYALPALLGVFWGAPLIARELEAGTFRLAWNQSITRTRWLTVKLALLGAAAVATAGLLSLMLTWWASPVSRVLTLPTRNGTAGLNRFTPLLFGVQGVTPAGYAAFAFALGVTLGVLVRRTVPAMAAALAIFAAIQIVTPLWIRPHYLAPVVTSTVLQTPAIDGMRFSGSQVTVFTSVDLPGAWTLSSQVVTAGGQPFTGPPPAACESQASGFQQCAAALSRLHLRQVVTYQPASRYWPFQWYETGVFLVLALALAGLCLWWIRRRRLS